MPHVLSFTGTGMAEDVREAGLRSLSDQVPEAADGLEEISLPPWFAEQLGPLSSPDQDKHGSHRVEISPSFHLHISLAEDDGANGSLFAFSIWNGSLLLACYLDNHPAFVRDKRVIEFGAAGALPSMVALRHGGAYMMITDYPDARLLQAIERTLQDRRNAAWLGAGKTAGRVGIMGHVWGRDTAGLLGEESTRNGQVRACLGDMGDDLGKVRREGRSSGLYDLALVGECLWLHQEHENLLQSLHSTLCPGGTALISFAHHVPGCEDKDMKFFMLAAQARQYGNEQPVWFEVQKLLEKNMVCLHREGKVSKQFLYSLTKRSGG